MSLRRLLALSFVLSIAQTAHAAAIPNEYLVQLARDAQALAPANLEAELHADVLRQVRQDLFVVRKEASTSAEALHLLSQSPVVQIVEPNFIFHKHHTPNDPLFTEQWALRNIGQKDSSGQTGLVGLDIHAENAWNLTTGLESVTISIVDSGVDLTHPDLAPNAFVNLAEASGKPGIDDDKNGFIDDINGWDFLSQSGKIIDKDGHGTHVAGIAAARSDNAIGVAGVAWSSRILSVRFLDENGDGTLENAVKAFDYSVQMGARIINASWGANDESKLLAQAVARARAHGVLIVASAGNEGANNDQVREVPATYGEANIISVTSVDNRGQLPSYANFGRVSVHLAAPGEDILSTAPGGRYVLDSGTSMAAPFVSGVAALLLSLHPDWDYKRVKERLLASARPLASMHTRTFSGGLLNAEYALTGEKPLPDPDDPLNWPKRSKLLVSSPHPYPNSYQKTYTIHVPGAARIALHFARFETEPESDTLEFFDNTNRSYGKLSGRRNGRFGPLIDCDTVIMRFTSDKVIASYGFDIDFAAYEPKTCVGFCSGGVERGD